MAQPTPTVKCTCKHEDNDRRFGPGIRHATISATGVKRCGVCGKEHGKADRPKKK